MPAVDETEEILLRPELTRKSGTVGEEKRKVTNNHLLVTLFRFHEEAVGCLQYLAEIPSCREWYMGTAPVFLHRTGLYPRLTPIS